MERRSLLKALGALGVGSMLPAGAIMAEAKNMRKDMVRSGVDCVLIPQETEGPYGLDLSGNAGIFRQDITEGRPGISLDLVMTIVNVNDNCRPIPNARVDIWHCDKDGVYSGYNQPGANTVGQTFMRGIQMTDSNGQVKFHTIYPGWYTGRITHIHFQVFMSSVLKATSQMAFPDSLNTDVYNTPLYAAHGQNDSVASNAADMVFGSPVGALQYELLAISPNASTGGYDGTFTVGINAPIAGLTALEPETGGQFVLRQNYPNPFRNRTTLSFMLAQASSVKLKVHDMAGNEVKTLADGPMEAGEHMMEWDGIVTRSRAAAGNYLFQLTVENSAGTFMQSKVMTVE